MVLATGASACIVALLLILQDIFYVKGFPPTTLQLELSFSKNSIVQGEDAVVSWTLFAVDAASLQLFTIELHTGSVSGSVVASRDVQPNGSTNGQEELSSQELKPGSYQALPVIVDGRSGGSSMLVGDSLTISNPNGTKSSAGTPTSAITHSTTTTGTTLTLIVTTSIPTLGATSHEQVSTGTDSTAHPTTGSLSTPLRQTATQFGTTTTQAQSPTGFPTSLPTSIESGNSRTRPNLGLILGPTLSILACIVIIVFILRYRRSRKSLVPVPFLQTGTSMPQWTWWDRVRAKRRSNGLFESIRDKAADPVTRNKEQESDVHLWRRNYTPSQSTITEAPPAYPGSERASFRLSMGTPLEVKAGGQI